jgi:hypothetical protein
MKKITRVLLVALPAVGMTMAGAAQASADTNKNEQKSSMICNVAPTLAHTGPCASIQSNAQDMDKHKTVNSSVIDYFGGSGG